MTSDDYLNIAQIVISVVVIGLLLFQVTGGGLGGIFGESDTVYRTRRGIAKTLFRATIVCGVVFFGLAIIRLWLFNN